VFRKVSKPFFFIYNVEDYSEATERSSVDGRDNSARLSFTPLVVLSCLKLPLAYVNQPKELLASEDYRVVIITKIAVDRMRERLKVNALEGRLNNSREGWRWFINGDPFRGL
jgi:hypothetical protein